MINKGAKITALILVISLLVLSGNLSAAIRKGVKLVIQTTDGQEVVGELVTVKRDSLLLMNAETREDTTVNLSDIDVIVVDNKSLAFELGMGGFLLAGATRLVLHSVVEKGSVNTEGATEHQLQEVFFVGAAGGVAGVIFGLVAGINKTIQIQGESEADIQDAMNKLSKKARVKGIQQ